MHKDELNERRSHQCPGFLEVSKSLSSINISFPANLMFLIRKWKLDRQKWEKHPVSNSYEQNSL
jgi:hypothetical protein